MLETIDHFFPIVQLFFQLFFIKRSQSAIDDSRAPLLEPVPLPVSQFHTCACQCSPIACQSPTSRPQAARQPRTSHLRPASRPRAACLSAELIAAPSALRRCAPDTKVVPNSWNRWFQQYSRFEKNNCAVAHCSNSYSWDGEANFWMLVPGGHQLLIQRLVNNK